MRVGKLDEGWGGWYDKCDYRRILSQHTWHTLYRYIVPALFTLLIASSSQFNGHRRRRRGGVKSSPQPHSFMTSLPNSTWRQKTLPVFGFRIGLGWRCRRALSSPGPWTALSVPPPTPSQASCLISCRCSAGTGIIPDQMSLNGP